MPLTPHVEQHFQAKDVVRDVVIGMSDGLTVPFALAAGLAGAVDDTGVVVTAGLAEIAAGSIAMGLGGYLAAKTDREHYHAERHREVRETHEVPEREEQEVAQVFEGYGLAPEQVTAVVAAIRKDRERWVDFMMRFELGLEEPDPRRARRSAATIGLSYVAGGLVPLLPYFLVLHVMTGFWWSVAVTLAALLVFGIVKGRFTGLTPIRSGLQTLLIGGLAAAAAYGIALAVG